MLVRLKKALLFLRVFLYSVRVYLGVLSRFVTAKITQRRAGPAAAKGSADASSASLPDHEPRNIVIVGASFAGYHAARVIASSLPADTPFRVVVIEPNSHFQFTWVLPRYSVVPDHEQKAFIPYGPYLANAPDGRVRWVRDRAVGIGERSVRLRGGEDVPYAFLVVATGSGAEDVLPSRVGAEGKSEGVDRLREMQLRIKEAKKIVVVGGGAAGVELATDAKGQYPEKDIVLVHSRPGVMHRFGPELQAAALKGLQELGVEVLLEERLLEYEKEKGKAKLKSGRTVSCDLLINCTGQRASSSLLADLSPDAIAPSGKIRVHPTLQIADAARPNIYACGDVAEGGARNDNARSAMTQAGIVADNIVLAARGRPPSRRYKPHWADGVIKLTLGLENSVVHFGDGKTELLFFSKEKDLALMSDGAWRAMGATPFEEPELDVTAKFN